MAIRLAVSDEDLRSCFPVMNQLRTGYTEDDFVVRVRLQGQDGYRLSMLVDGSRVVAVAGYRFGETSRGAAISTSRTWLPTTRNDRTVMVPGFWNG